MNTFIPNTQMPHTSQEHSPLNNRASRLEYLSTIPWQLFSTHFITNPNAGSERRRSIWHRYLARVRALHRDTLAYIWSEESRSVHDDLHRVPVHYHALWFSNNAPDTRMLANEWNSLAGLGGKPIEIDSYDPCRDGLAYVLKLADRDDCHWDFSNNLSLFLPEGVDLSNAQCRRRNRRHLGRANGVLPSACVAGIRLTDGTFHGQ